MPDKQSNYSVTYVGIIIMLVSFLFRQMDIPLLPAEVEGWVMNTGQIIGALIAFYGRWRRGDVKWFGGRILQLEKRPEEEPEEKTNE